MIISRTPFRISFFGGGTDYPQWYREHGGQVLSTTIDKYCYLTCRRLPRFFDYTGRIVYTKTELVKSLDDIQHPAVREGLRFMGLDPVLEITHAGDLPARAGLGASSSFLVGLLHTLYIFKGTTPGKLRLAKNAITVERDRIGETVGSQDQTASAFGGLNIIRFRGDDEIEVNPLNIAPERIAELESHLMLYFTGLLRAAPEYAARQVRQIKRKKSILERMAEMVEEGAEILGGDESLDHFGKLLDEAWRLKRSLAEGISNPTIDSIYETARRAGAIGGKLLGAGGGGFILFFARPGDQPAIRRALEGLQKIPFRFEYFGSQIIVRDIF
ncbi:MAG: kinase [Candidatus Hydrogenedentota bacterium]|nr:MAG: kinase [Candidatus Hydrogenedentota bacterium]